MNVSEYIKERLSLEEYSFSWIEIRNKSTKSDVALKRELSRLVTKKEILLLRKGFYLIIPPRYSNQGKLPINLYINKFFTFLEKNYYLGLYSAAKLYGASHQQIQRDYVLIKKPSLLPIKKEATDIRFFTTSHWPVKNIIDKKSDAGYFKVSSPALTTVDLIHYQTKIGGLNRVLIVLEELIEEITYEDMSDLLIWYHNKSTLQRLGFILEMFEADNKLTGVIYDHLQTTKYYPTLLNPKSGQKPGAVDNRWKVVVNLKIETDL